MWPLTSPHDTSGDQSPRRAWTLGSAMYTCIISRFYLDSHALGPWPGLVHTAGIPIAPHTVVHAAYGPSSSATCIILQRRSERPLWHTVSYDSPSNVLYSKARIYIIQYTLRHTGPTARQNAGAVGGGGGARGAPDSCRRSSLRSGAMPRSLLSPRDDARLRCHQSCMLICSHVRK